MRHLIASAAEHAQLHLEDELSTTRPAATQPTQPPPSSTTAQRAADRARGFAKGPGLLALVTGVAFGACVVALALLIAHDVAAQDYAAAPPMGGGATPLPPQGADPIYFVWMAVAQALTGALALLVAWVQAGGKSKDAKIAELERQRDAQNLALDAMRERAYSAEATLRAFGAVRSGELPPLAPPASPSPTLAP